MWIFLTSGKWLRDRQLDGKGGVGWNDRRGGMKAETEWGSEASLEPSGKYIQT